MLLVGIDTGKHTGIAVWSAEAQKLTVVATVQLHTALEWVHEWSKKYPGQITVYFEDARQRTWYGRNTEQKDRARLQGAGSVKRDSTIWEDALTDWGIPFHAIAPKNNVTKMTAEYFRKITGWQGKTSEHARDAAMLVFGR